MWIIFLVTNYIWGNRRAVGLRGPFVPLLVPTRIGYPRSIQEHLVHLLQYIAYG